MRRIIIFICVVLLGCMFYFSCISPATRQLIDDLKGDKQRLQQQIALERAKPDANTAVISDLENQLGEVQEQLKTAKDKSEDEKSESWSNIGGILETGSQPLAMIPVWGVLISNVVGAIGTMMKRRGKK